MSTLAEIEQAALGLADDERAMLVAKLWESLSSAEEDEAVALRLKELANDPAGEISHDEFIAEVQKARRFE